MVPGALHLLFLAVLEVVVAIDFRGIIVRRLQLLNELGVGTTPMAPCTGAE